MDGFQTRYPHHGESLQRMIDYFSGREEIIALVFGGSVAKGCERPDSDLDAMVVVTEDYYRQRQEQDSVTETIDGLCTYEGGYFDVKYMTKAYLQNAADHASEPTRNSFLGSRVLFTSDSEIPGIVARIPVFQQREKAEKQLSFFSNLWLNHNYFWKACKPEGYMKTHVISEIVYSVYRLILQENEILFPCNRRLEEFVEKAPNKPEGIVELCRAFCEQQTDDLCDRVYDAFCGWTSFDTGLDSSAMLSSYTADFEQWWNVPRPFINEW